mmetsp:Transcript_37249/g.95295  ORF Transcript_37249/g.95295 Transcript_37249/m.95295 type:complete len:120 (+) Transcript_37249:948-1307(+)
MHACAPQTPHPRLFGRLPSSLLTGCARPWRWSGDDTYTTWTSVGTPDRLARWLDAAIVPGTTQGRGYIVERISGSLLPATHCNARAIRWSGGSMQKADAFRLRESLCHPSPRGLACERL